MSEEWRAILGGTYEVSSVGNVRRATAGRRTHAGRTVKPILMKIGYLVVGPVVNGKNKKFYVHELVALAFIGPRPEGLSINHKDGDKTNNVVANLEYVTHAENMAHAAKAGLMARGERHGGSKISDADAAQLCVRRAAGESLTKLAREFGVAVSTASQIANGHRRAA